MAYQSKIFTCQLLLYYYILLYYLYVKICKYFIGKYWKYFPESKFNTVYCQGLKLNNKNQYDTFKYKIKIIICTYN